MIFTCFLDDSKDRTQTRLMVSAGFFGAKDDWKSLRIAWKRVLRKHGMDYFKSSEYYRLEGQFARFRTNAFPPPKGREAARQVRSDLQTVLKGHPGIAGIGVAVLLDAYNKVLSRSEALKALPRNPYLAALNSVVFETVRKLRTIPGHNAVQFVHDNGDDFDVLRSSYEKFKQLNPTTAKKMGSFIPRDDKDDPELQAADMVSNYTMQLGLEALDRGDMRPTLKEMKSNIVKLGYWDENYILSVVKRKLVRHGMPIPIDLQDERYG